MTRFRHDLILRMIKLLDAVLVTIPFAMCWYLYYAKRVASPYYAKGDYLVVALFFVLFIIFGRVYDAFLMSMQRISEIIYEQFFCGCGQRLYHVHCDLATVQAPAQHSSWRGSSCGAGYYGLNLGL